MKVKNSRTVVIEFPSYDEANNFTSQRISRAHSILKGYAERQHQIIEGATRIGSSSLISKDTMLQLNSRVNFIKF